jgi:hypothetical protein
MKMSARALTTGSSPRFAVEFDISLKIYCLHLQSFSSEQLLKLMITI